MTVMIKEHDGIKYDRAERAKIEQCSCLCEGFVMKKEGMLASLRN